MFKMFPHFQKYFKAYSDVPLDKLQGLPKLVAHGTSVISYIAGLMSSLNSPEVLVEMILKAGYTHGPMMMKSNDFKEFKPIWFALLKDVLNDEMTDDVVKVWEKTADFIVMHIMKGLDQYYTEH